MKIVLRQLLIAFCFVTALVLVVRLTTTNTETTEGSVVETISPSSNIHNPNNKHKRKVPASVSSVNLSGMSVSDLVKKLIADNVVMVFSKTWCPYCAKAKRILSKYSPRSYQVLELDERQDGDAIQEELGKMTGARSVPRVFIGGKCIGGGDDTEKLDKQGKLEAMLKEAGAL